MYVYIPRLCVLLGELSMTGGHTCYLPTNFELTKTGGIRKEKPERWEGMYSLLR